MAASYLSSPHFHDEAAAIEFVEARVWPNGPVCPHCGSTERIGRLQGKSTRLGVLKCYACRKPFTVRVGTIFEDSHLPLHLWLQAIFLVASSKKGISSNQLHRVLGVTLKTAWFLSHRIRLSLEENVGKLSSGGGIVEADETFIGRKLGEYKRRGGFGHKNTVLALVERGGKVRSEHVTDFSDVGGIFQKHGSADARLMTDEPRKFRKLGKDFKSHEVVNHSQKEYARGDVSTNTIEGVFSIFKRGMTGVYQHCEAKYLHRYLAEFDFRYNNRISLGVDDHVRASNMIAGAVGKRLTYQKIA